MKNHLHILAFIGLLVCNYSLFAQDEWRYKACPAIYQGGGISFALGNNAYVVGGDTAPPSASGISAAVWEYNATTNIWSRKNNFPHSANNPSCFVINDTAYVGLGLDSSSTYHTDFWRYDQAGDQWIQMTDFPGAARYGAMAFSLNGKGYVGCGHGVGENSDFYSYDPLLNAWTPQASFPGAARQTGIGAAAGGKGYMGMGAGNSNYNDIYQYNDSTDSWTQIGSYTNSGRYSLGAFVINDTLYVIGGTDGISFYHDCWSYSTPNNTWSSQAGFGNLCPESVFIQDGFAINGHGYARPLEAYSYLYILLEFGPVDTAFVQRIPILGNDTSYSGNFSRTLTAPDSSAVWSTGATGSQITVTSPGTYWVRWNVPCGLASDTIRITDNVGIAQVLAPDPIQVFPNPVYGNATELLTDVQFVNSPYEIYDMSGRLVLKGRIMSEHSYLDLSGYSGVYSLFIMEGNRTYVSKIVKF